MSEFSDVINLTDLNVCRNLTKQKNGAQIFCNLSSQHADYLKRIHKKNAMDPTTPHQNNWAITFITVHPPVKIIFCLQKI